MLVKFLLRDADNTTETVIADFLSTWTYGKQPRCDRFDHKFFKNTYRVTLLAALVHSAVIRSFAPTTFFALYQNADIKSEGVLSFFHYLEMEKLALLNTVSKSTIQNAVDKGEWLDGTILTRHMIRKLQIHAAQMDDSVRFEK